MTVYRPELHVTAERGILEGPAGIYRTGKAAERVWNMFYQYRPTPDAPSRWGHQQSAEDAFSWIDCNDVIVPVGGEIAVRAGSVSAAGDGVDLYFTSATAAGNTIQVAHVSHVDELCADLDDDADLDVSGAAARLGAVVEDVAGVSNFRSPLRRARLGRRHRPRRRPRRLAHARRLRPRNRAEASRAHLRRRPRLET